MNSVYYKISIEQGTTYELFIDASKQADLMQTDVLLKGEIRSRSSNSTLIASFSFERIEPYTIRMYIPSSVTKLMNDGVYKYDVFAIINNGSNDRKILNGDIEVIKAVTNLT